MLKVDFCNLVSDYQNNSFNVDYNGCVILLLSCFLRKYFVYNLMYVSRWFIVSLIFVRDFNVYFLANGNFACLLENFFMYLFTCKCFCINFLRTFCPIGIRYLKMCSCGGVFYDEMGRIYETGIHFLVLVNTQALVVMVKMEKNDFIKKGVELS